MKWIFYSFLRFVLNKLRLVYFTISYSYLFKSNKKLKMLGNGRDIVIFGGGASVNDFQINFVKGKDVMFTNNFMMHSNFEKICDLASKKYYIIPPIHSPQDISIWEKWVGNILKSTANCTFFLGANSWEFSLHKWVKSDGNTFFYFPIRNRFFNENYESFNLTEIDKPLSASGAVGVYALSHACYMGYKNIFLSGYDHSQLFHRGSKHKGRFYSNSYHHIGEVDKDKPIEESLRLESNTLMQYRLIKQLALNSKILNIGGEKSMLEVFERCNVEGDEHLNYINE
jgi:hypothetical protein